MGIAHLDIAVPTSLLAVFTFFHRPIQNGYDAGFVLIARYIAHGVVGAIPFLGIIEGLRQLFAAPLSFKGIDGRIVHVEVELRIKHATTEVGADELRASVGFANLVVGAMLGNRYLGFDFVGKRAPEGVGDVLGGIVTEAIYIEVLEPPQGRIGEGVNHFGFEIVKGGHEIIEPGCEAIFIPALGIF